MLRNKVAGTAPGTSIKLTVVRDGKELELNATLDEFSASDAKKDGPGDNAWVFAGTTRYRVPWDFVLALLAGAAIDRYLTRRASASR